MNLLYRDGSLLLHLHMKLLAQNFHFNLKNTHIPCKHTPELKESCLNKEKKRVIWDRKFSKVKRKSIPKSFNSLRKKTIDLREMSKYLEL